MDLTSWAIFPLLLASIGVYGLYKLLQKLRSGAYLQAAVVVITGATSGLGKECAKVFYAAGSHLVLCGRDEERLKDLVQELNNMRLKSTQLHKPHMVIFDLSDVEAVNTAAKEILHLAGRVDILINNAGISYRGTILDTKVSVDRMVMDTNYFGPVALTKALLPSMIKNRRGHVVVISSVQGKISIPFRSAYSASKHATQAFFDCLRAEMSPYDIDVTVVNPGYIKTNLSLNAVTGDGSGYGVMDKNTADGRTPEEVAQTVLRAVGERRKELLVAGLVPTLAVYLRTLAPTLFFSIMSARAKKRTKAKGFITNSNLKAKITVCI
ncbi:dehydrogenase/reductase SDR family member 7B [Xenopus laevis]|uniref:Peroxisomal reductase activating PPAR-gamma n=1 Tax=Xenopus laevis TaxID=8355 RepID=PEXRP_XENLA|nr:dehydrogenase/reductase SDR family member 7B [Xenopus laevis]Q0IH28.1 RecName: Full=Dehydrogenase/reductase SDR family member 7B; AltName: Full=Short-chain dehydrogenase/reductase family 32C member 1; Short=Protein SDR32C1 [Xenopus laevis]AAI23347.1 MGC154832 protein [Xenopus laevis]